MNVEKFAALERKVKQTRREADRARGALDQAMRKLKEEFGVDTEAKARKLLAKSEKMRAELKEEFDAKHEAFLEKWSAYLDRVAGDGK